MIFQRRQKALLRSKVLRVNYFYIFIVGYYIYIEASAPRVVGDRAWLDSESFSVGSPNCLSFWYNMNGQSIGALRVWVSSQTGARTPIWELKGNQGANWVMGRVNIPKQTTSYKVHSLSLSSVFK